MSADGPSAELYAENRARDGGPRLIQSSADTDTSRKPVILRKDGLVDMEVPENVKQVVERNSKHSPLLQLPPEIRHRIWKFALGFQTIKLNYQPESNHLGRRCKSYADKRIQRRIAFSLPRVCRQIYAETSTMIYFYTVMRLTKLP
jgi:hypothetical protein